MALVNGNGLSSLWRSVALGLASVVLLVQIWIDVDHLRVAKIQAERTGTVEKIKAFEDYLYDMRERLKLIEYKHLEETKQLFTRIAELERAYNGRMDTMSQRILAINNRLDTLGAKKPFEDSGR